MDGSTAAGWCRAILLQSESARNPSLKPPERRNLRLISITYLMTATMLNGGFGPLFTVQTPKCKLLDSRYFLQPES
jgi:hypothetical protein